MKKLILVWQQEFIHYSNEHFWGLGDLIRGTIATIQFSKKYNLKLIIDIHNHPISNFLSYKSNIEEKNIFNKNDIFFIPIGNLENNIKIFISDKRTNLIFGTNEFCSDKITEDEKDIIKNILTPNEHFQKSINDYISILPENFTIQHYRIGDEELVRNIKYNNFNTIIDKIKNNYNYTDILLSDSLEFKRYVKKYFNIFLFDNEICHTGCEKNNLKLQNTLLEFFIIINSKKIKTYRWTGTSYISGFVNWISKIYNIPLEIIE